MIACDSQATDGETKEEIAFPKIRKLNGELYGLSGHVSARRPIWDWIRSGAERKDLPDLDDYEWQVLRVNARYAYVIDSDDFDWLRVNQPYGIGSGGKYAVAALKAMGRDINQDDMRHAVRIACSIDAFSGGRVRILAL